MKHIQLTNILFKLTKKYDIFSKEELYVILDSENYKCKLNLIPLNNNIWVYKETIYIPIFNCITITVYDKDVLKDDLILKEIFHIGGNNCKNNLTIEYKIVEIIESIIYQEEKRNLLSEIDYQSTQSVNQNDINKTLKEKNKDLNSCIRIYKMKMKQLEKDNTILNNMKEKIKDIVN